MAHKGMIGTVTNEHNKCWVVFAIRAKRSWVSSSHW